jgi:hypothetical protein
MEIIICKLAKIVQKVEVQQRLSIHSLVQETQLYQWVKTI